MLGLVVALIGTVLAIQSAPISQAAAQTRTCQGLPATIVGTVNKDRIVGTAGPDVIVALGGADVIMGRGGNDVICGGWGNDIITAGGGFDRVYGGPGADNITGGPNDDQLFGGKGRDLLVGNAGDDVLNGGPWADSLQGGRGDDVLNGGVGPDRLVGGEGTDTLNGGAGRDVCAIDDPNSNCEQATLATRTTTPEATEIEVDRVLHISIDGLRPDHVTQWLTPSLFSLVRDGVSTMNARTDPDRTTTLPNHTAQLTGRPVDGPDGHGITLNEDFGRSVHDEAGEYVASVLDVANDNDVKTAMYVGKEKFEVHARSWDIDRFVRDSPEDALEILLDDLDDTSLGEDDAYIFFHIRLPDSAGHGDGWGSQEYSDSVAESDALVGEIISHIQQNPEWSNSTGFIVTADHGGPIGEDRHHDNENSENFTIPFIVSAPGAAAGSDLYGLNPSVRANPGEDQIGLTGLQPIRGHDAGNLALDLLGLPAIPGSVFNARQDLRLN